MQNKKSMDVRTIVAIGLMAALVFIFSKFRIDIPSPLGKTGIHFGNIMCLLGGLLFGAVPGGLAAGIGSALLDLTDPVYAPEFAMGFVAGWLGRQAALQGRRVMVWVAAAAGSLTYVVLYGLKNILMGHFVQGFTWAAAIGETMTLKVPVSVGNGIIAVICAALLAMALAPSLHKAHLLEQ